MLDKELLEKLVCPQDQTPLELANEELLAGLNRAIAAGEVKNQVGRTVEESLAGGLVRQDKTLLYPIVDEIPVLLSDEAISLDQVG